MFKSSVTNYKRSALMAAGGALHSYAKYRRFGNRRLRTRTRHRYGRKSYTVSKRKRRSTKKRIAFSRKRKNLSRARKRGSYKYLTAKRVEKVQLSFTIANTGDNIGTTGDAVDKWFGSTLENMAQFQAYDCNRFKSLSWKFDNIKVRTILRTVTTEGNPPEETTQEQILEPRFIQMRYRWNNQINPNTLRFHDHRIEEIMQHKCITNCKDKFWGIYKPKNTISLARPLVNGDIETGERQRTSKTTL